MSKLNCIYGVAAVILVLHATSVKGLNLPALKTAFTNFFDTLDTICGNQQDVIQARNQYNNLAERAETYQDLINCAVAAYTVYHPYIRSSLHTQHDKILNLKNSFSKAILEATTDETDARLRLIPIPAFTGISTGASTAKLQRAGNRQERI